MSQTINLQLAEQCFSEARITDELCPSSIRKYASSVKAFFAIIGPKGFQDLNRADFDGEHTLFVLDSGE